MDYPLTIIDHPLAAHKLTLLRDEGCDSVKARQLVYELGLMLTIGMTRDVELAEWEGTAFDGLPLRGTVMKQWNVIALPILRGGLVLRDSFVSVLPSARTGHLGIHHDHAEKDMKPQVYMISVPSAPGGTSIFILDSLLGTGETMKSAVDELRKLDIRSDQLRIGVLSVHEAGLAAFYRVKKNREIPIYAFERRAETDEQNLLAFGFGDIADRIYGTG